MRFDPQTVALIAAAVQESFPDEFEGEEEGQDEELMRPKKLRKTHNSRNRRFVNSIFTEMGIDMTRRAYRMHATSFWKL